MLGSFTTGVTIVTTRGPDGAPIGITVNSFNSVSLQPPLVLWSISRTAHSLAAFEAGRHWAVHILSAGQEALSNRFAKSGADKFSGVDFEVGLEGIPLINGCTGLLQCRNVSRYEGGDHVIFVGEVVEFKHDPIAPLVFQLGRYAVASRKSDGISINNAGSRKLDIGFDEDFLGYLLARAHFQFFSRMSELISRLGLDDVHVYILFGLSVNETRSIDELNRIMRPARQDVTPGALKVLRSRGLVTVKGKGKHLILRLTEAGHRIALDTMAECKTIESSVLDKLGYWNANAFKNLLKQFIVETDIGMPHPWESSEFGNSKR